MNHRIVAFVGMLLLCGKAAALASTLSRRSALAAAAAAAALSSPGSTAPTAAAEEEENSLISELLQRTEANKGRNAAIVKRATEANSFTAIDGTVDRRLVSGLDGRNIYMNGQTVRELTRQRRIACFANDCRMVEPSYEAPPLDLPEIKRLACDAQGRNCRFQGVP